MTNKRYINYICVAICIISECVSAVLINELDVSKQIISYTNNFYVAVLNLLLGSPLLIINKKLITTIEFVTGLAIGVIEYLLFSEFIVMEISQLFFKFCESFTIILLYMATEIISGHLKKLELNTGAIFLSTVIMSVFVFMEIRAYDVSIFMLLSVLFLSSVGLILKQLIYSSQSIIPFLLANNVKLCMLFLFIFIDNKNFKETKGFLYNFWNKHKIRYVFYILTRCIYSFSEYFCLKRVDLDVLMVAKILTAQFILIYQKIINK